MVSRSRGVIENGAVKSHSDALAVFALFIAQDVDLDATFVKYTRFRRLHSSRNMFCLIQRESEIL